jgi:protein-tyrosine-phosphatase
VCYGNIYRSAFLAAHLAQCGEGRWEVRSGGFHPVVGRSCPDRHVALASVHGVDLHGHRSALVTREVADWADLVVVMDRHNWHAVRALGVPGRKIVWAGAMTSGNVEIGDPYDASDAALARTIERLVEASDAIAESLAGR